MDLFKEILDTKTSSSSPRFRMQMADLATAVVMENWDKEHPGCVKVEYILGADGAKTSDWIRVLHGYAGKDSAPTLCRRSAVRSLWDLLWEIWKMR